MRTSLECDDFRCALVRRGRRACPGRKAKGAGACLKHVLNTRIWPGSPPYEETIHAHDIAELAGWARSASASALKIGGAMSVEVLRAPDQGAHADEHRNEQDRRLSPGQLEGLFRAHAPRLLRFFRGHTSEQEEAADLLQETFARLACSKAPAELRSPEAYLQRIAANLLKDRFRETRTRPVHLDISVMDIADASVADADAFLEKRELLVRFDKALLGLRPRTRDVFLRHRVDGLTYAEIARDAGLSVSAVEKHMMKAIAHIDRSFGRR